MNVSPAKAAEAAPTLVLRRGGGGWWKLQSMHNLPTAGFCISQYSGLHNPLPTQPFAPLRGDGQTDIRGNEEVERHLDKEEEKGRDADRWSHLAF